MRLHIAAIARVAFVVVVALLATSASATSETDAAAVAAIPNGDNVRVNGHWWGNPLRATPRGVPGLSALTAFGTALQAAGNTWTTALCQADSDGDGFTNGEELGDPSCVWTPGSTPARTKDISHPGLWSSVPTTTAYPGRTQTAAASCAFPSSQPPTVAAERAALTGAVSVPSGLSGVSREAELAKVSEPDADDAYVLNTYGACPYLAAGLKAWHDPATWGGSVPAAGTNVTLPAGTSVRVTACSLPDAGFATLTIPDGSALILDDSPIHLRIKQIIVYGGLYIGGQACPIQSPITVSFVALAAEAVVYNNGLNVFGSGVVDVVGATSVVHWTRLKTTAYSGATFIVLQKPVDWSFGDEIVIATSIWKDTIDDQNEVRRVQHRQTNNATVLQLNAPLVHKHYAGSEYQSEVALLTRSVLFRGGLDADSQSRAYGGHTWGVGPSATYRMVGVRAERMGQQNVMARYPFHMHMMYEGGNNSYIIGCACVSCYYRCYTVHGTNHSRVRRNVAYNSTGHTYYFEDGGEMFNTLEYNIAVKVNILGVPAAGGAQVGETEFSESAAALLPADRTASGYYVSNARNWVRGNAASGGWSGFAFPVFDTALKLSAALTVIPKAQQLLEFTGNTAHSSGHYWGDAGCIYAGGHLRTDSSGVMWYTNGRFSHPTAYPNGTAAWQNITNLRTWLCQKGYSSWGDRADLSNFECHDCTRSAVLFGQSSVVNMIVNGVSENRPYDMVGVYRVGFGFYDTWVQTMIVNITFRNFYRAPNDANWGASAAIVDLDHSDIYKPWGISAVRNLRYDAVERRIVVRRWIRESGASRMYNFMDWDGSVVNTATCQGQIIGSNIDWWNGYSDCWFEPLWPAWICPRRPGREVVGLDMELYGISSDAGMDIQADTTTNLITQAQRDALYIGNMSYFGSKSNQRLQLTRNHHLATGLSNTAWYMYLTTGVPEYFNIQPVNFPRGAYILLAISLPSDAQIVYVQTKGLWSYTNALNFTAVSTREQVLNGNGTQYAFDGRHLYIKFSDMYSPYPNAFSRAKVDIYSTQSAGGYNGYIYIQLKCPTKNSGGFCTTPADPDPPADLTTDMPTTVCDNITQLTTIPPLCPNETNVQNPAYGTVNCSSYASWMCAASWPKNYCRRSCLPQCVRNAPYPYTCSMDRGCTAEEKPTPVVDWCRELAAGHVLSSGAPLTSDPCWIARCNGTSRSMQRIQLGTNIPCYGEDTYGPLIGAMCSYSSNVCQGTSQGAANVTVSTLTIPGVTAAANSIDLSVWVAAGTVTSVTLWYRLAHDGVASGTNAASRSVAMSLVESQAATYRYTATSAVWGRITGNVTVAVTTSNWGVVYKTLTDLASTAATNPIVTVVSVNSTAVVLQATPVDYVMGVVLEVYTPSTATATAVTSVGAAFGAAPDLIVVPLTSALPSLSAGQVFAVTLSRINGGTQRVTLPCLGVADGTASANPIVDVRPALSYCAARLTNSYSNTWWFAVTPIDSTPIITNVTIQFGTKTTVIPQTQWYTFQGGPGAAMTSTIRVFVTLASGAVEQWNMSVPFPAMGQLLTCVKGSVADPEAPYRSEAPMPVANSGACISNNFALGLAPWTTVAPTTTTTKAPSTTAPTTTSVPTTTTAVSPTTAAPTTIVPTTTITGLSPTTTPALSSTTTAVPPQQTTQPATDGSTKLSTAAAVTPSTTTMSSTTATVGHSDVATPSTVASTVTVVPSTTRVPSSTDAQISTTTSAASTTLSPSTAAFATTGASGTSTTAAPTITIATSTSVASTTSASTSALSTTTPSPTTATPATTPTPLTTPAPVVTTTDGTKVLMSARLTLAGDYFGKLVNNASMRPVLSNAVKQDIAAMLNVTKDRVAILNLTVGSLVIDYALTQVDGEASAASAVIVASANATMSAAVGKGAMPLTTSLYATNAVPAGIQAPAALSVSSGSLTYVSSAAAPSSPSSSGGGGSSDDGTPGIAGGVVGGAVVLGFVVVGAAVVYRLKKQRAANIELERAFADDVPSTHTFELPGVQGADAVADPMAGLLTLSDNPPTSNYRLSDLL